MQLAKEGFGKTWWGNAWIEALEKGVSDKEILEEAKKNSLKGNIEDIKYEKGRINAKLSPEEGQVVEVVIKVTELPEDSKKIIRKIVDDNPLFVSELSLGKFPDELLEALNKENINLLPDFGSNIKAECSCETPDRPCLHIYTVFYSLAKEIDKDPFLLLYIRNVSKEYILQPLGIALNPESEIKGITDEKFVKYGRLKPWAVNTVENEVDLAFLDINIKSLFTLLSDNPLFYTEENFKLILIEKYKSLSSFVDNFEIEDEINPQLRNLDFHLAFFDRGINKNSGGNSYGADEKYPPVFIVSDRINISQIKTKPEAIISRIPEIKDRRVIIADEKLKVANLEDVLQFFISQPLEFSPDLVTAASGAFNLAASIALSMVKTFSYIPELVQLEDGSFIIHFVPLIHDEKTSMAVDILKRIATPNLVIKPDEEYALENETHMFLLSLFITHIVRYHDKKYGRNHFFFDQKIYNTFFKGDIFQIEKFEENNIAKNIVDWLERLTFRTKDISPVIKIDSITENKYAVMIKAENKHEPGIAEVSLKEVFESKKALLKYDLGTVRTDLFRQIKIAGDYFPVLDEILNSKGEKPGIISSEEMYNFATSVSETLNLLGIRVILPQELQKLKSPQLVASGSAKYESDNVTYFSLKDLLQINWEIEIGDAVVPVDDYYKLSLSSKGIVQIKGQYFLIKPEETEQIINEIKAKPLNLTSKDLIKIILTGEFNGKPFRPDERLRSLFVNLFTIKETELPEKLNAKLRPYQVTGYRWLYSNIDKEFGCCLADDMGLGKTVQVITLILKLKEEKPALKPILVICPTTLLGNWYKEISKFAPSLRLLIYHGSKRRMAIRSIDVVITSYGIVRSDIEKISKIIWEMVIIDEAQNIKNPDTEQTKSVKQINSDKHIAMSGTPVENRLTELWSIYDFINKDYLGSLGSFKKNYAIPIEKYRAKEKIEKLKKIVSPFLLRRLKSDENIINDLPEKIIFDEYCYLSDTQIKLYQETVKDAFEKIKGNKGIERKGIIFSLITHLKQICNHPAQFEKSGNIDPSISGKSEKLVESLEKMLDRQEKVIIFTQYKEMGDILVRMLSGILKTDILFFHGSLTRQSRDQMVVEFQENKNIQIMIVSLKAGGTGINLTAAKRVIHYDLWWNPAVETQATDRVYRIGQFKNITVHRFITLNTFEEKIDDMIKRKQELSDLTISSGENWITELTDRELKKIFSLS